MLVRVRGTGAAVALGALLVAGFFVARLASHDWRPGAFVVAGDRFVDAGQRPELPVATNSGGYDGQFVYRLALDPLTDQVRADGIELDNPPYRQGRIGLPVLGWLVDRLPGVPLTVALLLIEAAALVGSCWLGSRFAVAYGRSPLVGLVVGLSPGLVIAADRDLTEPVAMFFLLAGLDLWRRRRLAGAAALFAASVLTRETGLVVLAGMGGWHLVCWLRRSHRSADHLARTAVLLVPLAAVVGWQAYVRSVWGGWPAIAKGGDTFGTPLLRPLHGLLVGLTPLFATDRQHLLQHLWIAERLALLILLLVVAGTLVTSRAAVSLAPDLLVGWLAAALLAISMMWRADVQFVRAANEAIVVGLLALVASRGRWSVAGLWLAAGWSAAVAVAYAVAL